MSGENICDEKLFNEIFRKHAKELHDFLYYKYGKENNPADLVQEAFLKLWNNCQNIAYEKARSFLFTVANHQMLNELSRKKTALNYSINEPPKQYTGESPEYVMQEKEYMEQLKHGIASLSEEQRTAFLLNRIEGKRHKEIAEMLGISRKTVEKRIYTALKKLKDMLENI
jgi:RNA polymerase sigma-70 factor (ECF subfamily)